MAIKNDKPLRYKRKSSALTKVWNYMRRNRTFRVGDLMSITGISHNYLKTILWHLKNAGYIKIVEKVKPYSAVQYTLIKCTGAKSPSIINGVVYDYNTDEKIIIKPKIAHLASAPLKLLGVMDKSHMTKQEIIDAADVGESTARKLWSKFLTREVMFVVRPVQRKDGNKLFKIDIEKAKELKEDIENGSIATKSL